MFAKADLDDDGFVTADDFYNMMTHRVYWDSVKWLKNLFYQWKIYYKSLIYIHSDHENI